MYVSKTYWTKLYMLSSLFPEEAGWCQHSQQQQRKAEKQGSCKKALPLRISVNSDSLVSK